MRGQWDDLVWKVSRRGVATGKINKRSQGLVCSSVESTCLAGAPGFRDQHQINKRERIRAYRIHLGTQMCIL